MEEISKSWATAQFWTIYGWPQNCHDAGCCSLVTKLCPTFSDPMDCTGQASLSFTIRWSFLKLMFIESVMLFNHLFLCQLLLLLPLIFPSIRIFFSESALHIRWPKYWSFNFTISPSSEYSGLVSFRINWLDLFAVKGLSRVFFSTMIQSINSLALSLLNGLPLASIHDYWKNHRYDYVEVSWQSDVSIF